MAGQLQCLWSGQPSVCDLLRVMSLMWRYLSSGMQSALAHIQYARTVARDKGWRPWQRLVQQAHSQMVTAHQWAQTKAVQHAFRWVTTRMLFGVGQVVYRSAL